MTMLNMPERLFTQYVTRRNRKKNNAIAMQIITHHDFV